MEELEYCRIQNFRRLEFANDPCNLGEISRCQPVIVTEKCNVVAPRQVDGAIPAVGNRQESVGPGIAHARIAQARDIARDVLGGGVVEDYEFPVGKVLPEDRLRRVLEEIQAIVSWDYN